MRQDVMRMAMTWRNARFTNEVSYLRLMHLFNVQWVKLTLHYQNMCVLQDPWY